MVDLAKGLSFEAAGTVAPTVFTGRDRVQISHRGCVFVVCIYFRAALNGARSGFTQSPYCLVSVYDHGQGRLVGMGLCMTSLRLTAIVRAMMPSVSTVCTSLEWLASSSIEVVADF